MKRHRLHRLSRSIKAIIFIWATAIFAAVPIASQMGVIYHNDDKGDPIKSSAQCTFKRNIDFIKHTFTSDFALFFLIPLVVISILYTLIGLQLREISTKYDGINVMGRSDETFRSSGWNSSKSKLTSFISNSSKKEFPKKLNFLDSSIPPNSRNRVLIISTTLPLNDSQMRDKDKGKRSHSSEYFHNSNQQHARSKRSNGTQNLLRNLKQENDPKNDLPENKPLETIRNSNTSNVKLPDNKKSLQVNFKDKDYSFYTSVESLAFNPPEQICKGSRSSTNNMFKRFKSSISSWRSESKKEELIKFTRYNHKNILKMLITVVICFFICYAPNQAQRLHFCYVKHWTERRLTEFKVLFYVSGILFYVSTTINPILYNVISLKYRRAFKYTFLEIFHKTLPCWHFSLSFCEDSKINFCGYICKCSQRHLHNNNKTNFAVKRSDEHLEKTSPNTISHLRYHPNSHNFRTTNNTGFNYKSPQAKSKIVSSPPDDKIPPHNALNSSMNVELRRKLSLLSSSVGGEKAPQPNNILLNSIVKWPKSPDTPKKILSPSGQSNHSYMPLKQMNLKTGSRGSGYKDLDDRHLTLHRTSLFKNKLLGSRQSLHQFDNCDSTRHSSPSPSNRLFLRSPASLATISDVSKEESSSILIK
ncbi:unnamed protein product [Gordionus sp. m RMFG-2023]